MFREICQFGSWIRSGYFSNLSPVVNAVNEKSASIVILSNTRFSGQTVHTKEVSWPGYKFIRQDEAGLLIQYHAKLHVEEVVDREVKLEKNPILWLAVTQGMGQGQVRGERMTLVAIVHWKDEDRIVNSLIKAVDRVRARHPGCSVVIQGNLSPGEASQASMQGLLRPPSLNLSLAGIRSCILSDMGREDIKTEALPDKMTFTPSKSL